MTKKLKIVVFSGAGLSAESGIATFRASDGLWEQHRIEDVASPEGWQRDKRLVLEFYGARFTKMLECKPNAAHLAIAKLGRQHDVVCITQNIDGLLEDAGTSDVWHLHGRIDVAKCEFHHDIFGERREDLFEHAIIFGEQDYSCTYKTSITKPITLGDRCPKCGGQLRPDVVWFGEAVEMRQVYLKSLVETADVFIGVGTSAKVYPAAGLIPAFSRTPQKFFIDPAPAMELLRGFTVLEGTASGQLPPLVEKLLL
ncbi:MAG: silent information regulator protein Sir2 [Rhizobacter sp.]|nr:silent information regulator protein Sir2 [Chlorobiales bacterium]